MTELSVQITRNSSGTTLADTVFEQVQTEIVLGEIPPGTKISEADLAKRFGVSRGPLREAMRRLEARKLLEHVPHSGARVVSLSLEELLEIYYAREALEGMACRQAALNMTGEEISDLRTLLDVHGEDLDSDDGYYQKAGDLDFHYRVIQGSKNQTLITMLVNDLYYLVRMYRYQFSTVANRPQKAIKEHRNIVDAIEARDADLAEMLMRRHISSARQNIEANMND